MRARIVQIVGTNGKGSTGRFLAHILKNGGFSVGHFTSPHITSFTERFWIDGRDAFLCELDEAFASLSAEFKDALYPLSYFEILTVLGFWFFKDRVDFLILEAGVGGEKDSTTCFKKELLLVTPIDIDHEELLGVGKEAITRTKLKAANCKTIVGFQDDEVVLKTIKKEFADKDISFLQEIMSNEKKEEILSFAKSFGAPSYLGENLCLSYAGASALGVAPILDGLSVIEGRFQRAAKNVLLDVGHNAAAARRVAKELGDKKVVLIFNSFVDKNPKSALLELRENIKRVEILEVDNERIIRKEALGDILKEVDLPFCDFRAINDEEEYLVFGSFSVAARFKELI